MINDVKEIIKKREEKFNKIASPFKELETPLSCER
jgi:hypothetical protein